MIKKFSLFFFVLVFLNSEFLPARALKNKIIVKVDNNIITAYELKNKLKTSLILSNQEINQINIDKNKRRALTYLINLKLKKNELTKYKINLESIDIKNQLVSIASNDIEGFKNNFKKLDISYDLFVDELKIETGWKQLMFKIYNKKVRVNQEEIDKQVLTFLKKSSEIEELRISEIEIALDQNSNIDEEIKLIREEIDENGFEKTALKYSISTSSVNNGDIGWVNVDNLNSKMSKVLKTMKIGEVSLPIRDLNTLLFLKLSNKRTSKVENINADEFKKRLIDRKKNELFNLYSRSHLSKLKNNSLIEYK